MPLEITEEEIMQWETMLARSPDTCVPKNLLFALPYGKRTCALCGYEWKVWKVSDWNRQQRCTQCGELHSVSGVPIFPKALDMAHMHYGLATVSGIEGSGKSTAVTAMGFTQKEYYKRRICCNRPKKPAYGEYELVPSEEFIKELKTLSKLTDEYNADAKKGQVWDEDKVHLRYSQESRIYGCLYDNDEFHLILHAATRTKESRYWGDFGKQFRHYRILVLGQTPNELELDKKFWQERQTHRIYCAKSEYTPGYTVVTIFNCRMGMVVNRTEAGFEKWGKYFYTYSPPNIRKMLDIEIEDKHKELIITDKTEAEIIDAIKEKTHDANPRIKELFYARLVEKSKPELLRLFKEAAVISDGMFKGDITLVPAKYWKIKGLED